MIDLPTQKDLKHPHHRKAIGALVAAVVIFGIALAVYYLRADSPKEQGPTLSPLQQLAGKPVPDADLTAEQMSQLKELVGKPVPATTLTAEQKARLQELRGD